jgi:hypothetical protein
LADRLFKLEQRVPAAEWWADPRFVTECAGLDAVAAEMARQGRNRVRVMEDGSHAPC